MQKIEEEADCNGLQAIKVTFDSGILFATGKSDLSKDAKSSLDSFAAKMSDLTDTTISVFGHTDNTGSLEANQRVSKQRADAVSTYLQGKGIAASRITATGMDFSDPVASNDTEAGRKLNRRVEVYISANQAMIDAAEKAANEGKSDF